MAKIIIPEDSSPEKTRGSYGKLCGVVGIFFNLLLFGGKLAAGLISGAISVTADAFNNLSDAGSSVTALLGFRLAEQEPDREHPYGHGRFEYLSALAVAAMILIMAVELFRGSINKIRTPGNTEISTMVIVILAASIVVKGYMFAYNRRYGVKFNAPVLRAAATDSASDCITTLAVLVCAIVSDTTGLQLDGWAGIIVSGFIFYGGLTAAKDAINPLLGQPPSEVFVNEVKDIALSFDPVILGVHDLLVHDYGPGRRVISLHVEVPADGELIALHDVVDGLERHLASNLHCTVTIHIDPIVMGDPETDELHGIVEAVAGQIDKRISVHDFRIVKSDKIRKLIFDIAAPYDVGTSDSEISEYMIDRVGALLGDRVYTVINIDRY